MAGEGAEISTATIAPPAPKPSQPLVIPPLAPPEQVPTPEAPFPQQEASSPVNQMHSDPDFLKILQGIKADWEQKYYRNSKPGHEEVGSETREKLAEMEFRRRYPQEAKAYDEQQEK